MDNVISFIGVIFIAVVSMAVAAAAVFLVAVLIHMGIKELDAEKSIQAQYPTDFYSIIDDCGERASTATKIGTTTLSSFYPDTFLACISGKNITFALNGDTVKAR